MSCQTKPGPAAFCSFIEDVYQEKVTQADWHAIRELAAAEKGVIKLSRAQCDVDRVSDTALGLADKAAQENGITVDDELSSGGVQFDNRVEEMHASLASTSNTQGTLDVIDYLAKHGVLDTLARVRETKEDGSNTYICDRCEQPFVPVKESYARRCAPCSRAVWLEHKARADANSLTEEPTFYNCETCGKRFQSSLRGDRSPKCSDCTVDGIMKYADTFGVD